MKSIPGTNQSSDEIIAEKQQLNCFFFFSIRVQISIYLNSMLYILSCCYEYLQHLDTNCSMYVHAIFLGINELGNVHDKDTKKTSNTEQG